jgi:hypothetical protein
MATARACWAAWAASRRRCSAVSERSRLTPSSSMSASAAVMRRFCSADSAAAFSAASAAACLSDWISLRACSSLAARFWVRRWISARAVSSVADRVCVSCEIWRRAFSSASTSSWLRRACSCSACSAASSASAVSFSAAARYSASWRASSARWASARAARVGLVALGEGSERLVAALDHGGDGLLALGPASARAASRSAGGGERLGVGLAQGLWMSATSLPPFVAGDDEVVRAGRRCLVLQGGDLVVGGAEALGEVVALGLEVVDQGALDLDAAAGLGERGGRGLPRPWRRCRAGR